MSDFICFRWRRGNLPEKCLSYTTAVDKAIKSIKPDLLIVDFWYSPELSGPIHLNNVSIDSGMIAMQAFIDSISPYTCKIVMTLPHLTFDQNIGREFPKRLSQGLPLNKLNMQKSVWEKKREDGMKRVNALKCSKCTFLNIADAFCDERMCYSYDKELNIPYFDDWHHTTIAGLFKTMAHFKPMLFYSCNYYS
uniref:SGNH domain-containing protein n=1 Tax=Panagrolaimus davidi TaxID=227884 RepID=A0A914QZE3_9BILA